MVSVSWTSSQDPMSCIGSTDYCYQEWGIEITPVKCDITSRLTAEFWAVCYDTSEGCPLDVNVGSLTSNGYSGKLRFSIVAEPFCPQLLDEVFVEGSIQSFVDEGVTPAVPGINVFQHDHIWLYASFITKTMKSNFATGDDSLIDFVRLINLDMEVMLSSAPLQVVIDNSAADVTMHTDVHYTINLCSATALTFPYSSIPDSCLQNLVGNAAIMELQSVPSAEQTKVAFTLRLDERVIPVDYANQWANITFALEVEIFYNGVNNPSRRRMQVGGPTSPLRKDVRTLSEEIFVT
eukprot:UN23021